MWKSRLQHVSIRDVNFLLKSISNLELSNILQGGSQKNLCEKIFLVYSG